jgi:iron complex outermembrane receptor protein
VEEFMRAFRVLCAVIALCASVLIPIAAAAQSGVSLTGRLLHSVTGEPIGGVTVRLEELRRTTTAGSDGTFTFENVPPGTYHVSVVSEGLSSRRREVVVSAASGAPVDVPVDPELEFHEVVSVSADARTQFEAYQPTSVLVGQELSKQLEMSIGATLESQPGLASRSFGPTPARPVIRGLDGDRVLILQDGQRMGDLSSQSGDHGVAINPAAAQRIEVVRGPATLLYGANAIGGLVNVITEDIPTRPVQGAEGNVTFDLGSAAKEAGAAADVRVGNGRIALHAGGGGHRSSDVDTPAGTVFNSQSRNGFGNFGLSWTGANNYAGASYGYDDTKYGIPVIEEGTVRLTPRRHNMSFRAGGRDLAGAFDSYRATLAVRRYKHDELEGEEVGTAFKNDTVELELMGSHRAVGRLKGSLGAWVLDRSFDAVGAEALSPAVDQRGLAVFVYEELVWPHVTFQFGGRVDNARYTPTGEEARAFTTGSASAGLLLRPAAANEALTVAVSLARAARYPALEELFYFGAHPGNFAFEVGNPTLEPEHALGFDLALRWRSARASGEITYFRNDISNYLFRSPLTEEEFEGREGEFAGRFPGRGIGEEAHGEEEDGEEGHGHGDFPFVEYIAADSVLQGVEAHSDFQLTSNLAAEVGFDFVRGTLKAADEALPRIPPMRFRGGLRYQYNAFQVGGDVTVSAMQDRVFRDEAPTERYQLLRLFGAYSFLTGTVVNTITARLDNATDELYRNHLSFIKHLVPEMGRNFKLLYNVKF